MHPRCWLPRKSWQLEHNQGHGPFYFFPVPRWFLPHANFPERKQMLESSGIMPESGA